MGFFKKLFGGSDSDNYQTFNPVDIQEFYGLKPYVKGELTEIIKQKSYKETFKKFGFKSVILHSQIKSHFLVIDYLNDYFNKLPPEKIDFKYNLVAWKLWEDDYVNRFNIEELQQVFNSDKQIKSYDTSLNIEGFINNLNEETNKLINNISSSTFPTNIDGSKLYRYPGNSRYFVGLDKSDSKILENFFKYIFDKNDLNFIKEYSKQVVGWNSIYLFTPFHVIYIDYDYDNKMVIKSSDYKSDPGLHINFSGLRRISSDVKKSIEYGETIRVENYHEFLKNEYKQIKLELFDMFDFQNQIRSLKENSFKVHLKNDKFISDSNFIIRHLSEIESVIEESFEFLMGGPFYEHSQGYLYQSEVSFLKTQYLESKIFEFNIILNLSNLLIESVKEENNFLYQEIFLMIEPYKVFDKTIEKQILKELKNINKELRSINNNLMNIHNTLIKGFNMLNSQLTSLNNKMYYNNILTTINTYQLYKISNK